MTVPHGATARTGAALTLVAGVLAGAVVPVSAQADDDTAEITFEVTTPVGSPTVYIAGNQPALGAWDPGATPMEWTGSVWRMVARFPIGTVLEYKFTLGSWDQEGLGPSSTVMPNFTHTVATDATLRNEVVSWRLDPTEYMRDPEGGGVLGTLEYWFDVESQFLQEPRHVGVWLPPGYGDDPDRRYRVLYMSDGQNLFDPRIAAYGTDWGIDEAMVAGADAGLFEPAIVVAVSNSSRRLQEYNPWGEAPLYARFLIEELIPRVNAAYRTLTGPENTFHMGSSMGGLLSYYLVKEHPETFGACGCVSSHFPISEDLVGSISGDATPGLDPTPWLLKDIEAGHRMPAGVRPFFDHGTRGLDAEYGPTHDAVRAWLLSQGRVEGRDFLIREYEGADHNEPSWRARMPDQLLWMLGGRVPPYR